MISDLSLLRSGLIAEGDLLGGSASATSPPILLVLQQLVGSQG